MNDSTRLIIRMYLSCVATGIVTCGTSLLNVVANGGSLSTFAWVVAGIGGVVVMAQHLIAALPTLPAQGKGPS
jgi:hypothetical protein